MDNKKRLNEVSSTSLDVREDLVKRLLSVVPEAETDGKIDWDKLKQELTGVIDESPERYNFTWNGKKQAMKLAQLPSTATLKPNKEKSKNWDTTENLYIEGDNLEVLKLLQKSYANKIKLIYIDPPYNTGKDFVYKDNFKDTLANYLEQTGQVDSDGNRLSVNTDTSGRYHTDWLNMMYPRLKLARNLLTDDGVIFISIDDNEQANLYIVLCEIFGEYNHISSYVWESTFRPDNSSSLKRNNSETVHLFAKNKNRIKSLIGSVEQSDGLPSLTKNSMKPSTLFFKSGTVDTYLQDGEYLAGKKSSGYILENDIKVIDGKIITDFSLTGRVIWGQKYLEEQLLSGTKIIIKSDTFVPYSKKSETTSAPNTIIPREIVSDVLGGRAEVSKLFDGKSVFSYPKPTSLMKYFLKMIDDKTLTILDFFSGSSSSADAVMRLNAEDGGNRKFIMVQLPEQLSEKDVAYADGYRTIPEIAQERIRRAGDKIIDENPLFASKLDIGFKVFELDKSNIKKWNIDSTNLVEQIEMLQDNFETGSTPLDVIYEIMLKQGHSLTSHIVEENLDDSIVYTVEYGAMFIVLGNKINSSVANYIVNKIKELEIENSIVVFQDQQFESDSEKLNAIEILNENGVEYDNILSI